jgi:WD40 repeat protein
MVINYNLKYLKYKNKYLKLKNIIGGTLFRELPEVKIEGQINSLSFNNKNGHLAIGTNTNTLIYDNYKLIKTLKKEREDKTNCPVNHVSYSGTHLVTSCGKDAIVYEIGQDYKEINVCKGPKDKNCSSIMKMECAPDEKPIIPICYDNQEVTLWLPTETSMLQTVKKELELKGDKPKQIGLINSISWKGLRFATCSSTRVAIWNISLPLNVSTAFPGGSLIGKDFKLIAYVPHNYEGGDFIALVYENSSRILFYRCSDQFLDTNKRADFFIDTEHQKPKQYATSLDISGITLMVFHPTKKYLATCGTENKVNIWSFEEPEPDLEKAKPNKFLNKEYFKVIRTIQVEPNSIVTSIAFNNDDIAIGCKDGRLIIWQKLVPKK